MFSAAANAAVTTGSVTLVGQPGEPITGGSSLLFNDPAQIGISGGADSVTVNVGSFSYGMIFGAPSGTNLQVGEYGNSFRFPSAEAARLDVFGNGIGCNHTNGRFLVKDIHVQSGVVDRFWVVYEQHCDGQQSALFGEVRINEPATGFPIKVEPRAVNWPVTDVGQQGTTVPITVTAGQSATSVSTVALQGADASDFHIASNTCSGAMLAAGATCTVGVYVQPTTGSDRGATLAITDGSAHVTTVELNMVVEPVVTAISPVLGPAAGGTVVTISGRGFTTATGVTFGGTPATTYTIDSSHQITATTPAHTAAGVYVVVTGPHGHSIPISDWGYPDFTYVGPPDAPTGVSATADGSSGAQVSFSPPAFDGGAPIQSYKVVSSPGGIQATGSSSPVHVSGLEPFTSYTFTVTAINEAGSSPASDPSNSITTLKSTTTAILASQLHSIFGQPIAFAALVDSAFAGTPTGYVQFDVDGRPVLSTIPIEPSGMTSSGIEGIADVGSTIGASYGGDTEFGGSRGELKPDIVPASTQVSLASSANPATSPANVTVIAHVKNLDTELTPFGSVQFAVDGTDVLEPLALDDNGDAGIVGQFPVGAHVIAARYHDDTAAIADFTDSATTMTQTVNAPTVPTTTVVPTKSTPVLPDPTFVLGKPAARSGTVTISAQSIDPGEFTFTATTVRKFAGASAKRRVAYAAGKTTSPGANKPVALTLRPNPKARKLLKAQKKLRLQIVVTFQSSRGGAPKKATLGATVTSTRTPAGRAALLRLRP